MSDVLQEEAYILAKEKISAAWSLQKAQGFSEKPAGIVYVVKEGSTLFWGYHCDIDHLDNLWKSVKSLNPGALLNGDNATIRIPEEPAPAEENKASCC